MSAFANFQEKEYVEEKDFQNFSFYTFSYLEIKCFKNERSPIVSNKSCLLTALISNNPPKLSIRCRTKMIDCTRSCKQILHCDMRI